MHVNEPRSFVVTSKIKASSSAARTFPFSPHPTHSFARVSCEVEGELLLAEVERLPPSLLPMIPPNNCRTSSDGWGGARALAARAPSPSFLLLLFFSVFILCFALLHLSVCYDDFSRAADNTEQVYSQQQRKQSGSAVPTSRPAALKLFRARTHAPYFFFLLPPARLIWSVIFLFLRSISVNWCSGGMGWAGGYVGWFLHSYHLFSRFTLPAIRSRYESDAEGLTVTGCSRARLPVFIWMFSARLIHIQVCFSTLCRMTPCICILPRGAIVSLPFFIASMQILWFCQPNCWFHKRHHVYIHLSIFYHYLSCTRGCRTTPSHPPQGGRESILARRGTPWTRRQFIAGLT